MTFLDINNTLQFSKGINLSFLTVESDSKRIADSTTNVNFKQPDGVATVTPENAILVNGSNHYANVVTLGVNTAGTNGTATVIVADKEFPCGTVVSSDNGNATIIGKYAFFPYLLDNQTVTISGLDEGEDYQLTVYASCAEDPLNPMKTIDILEKTDPITIQVEKDRIRAELQLADGENKTDWRFVPQGTAREFNFNVETTGLETEGKLKVSVYVKENKELIDIASEEYFSVEEINVTATSKTVKVMAKTTAEVGTYCIVFSYGTASYNYDVIVHKRLTTE